MAYRHGARFVAHWNEVCRPIDRNTKAKIMALAEGLERRTKPAGRRNGVISLIGLHVLRALLWGFHNNQNGLCNPSYGAIQGRTGLCRQSIANALARLERAGVLVIVRRLVRQVVDRISPVTGLPERYVGTVQTSNLYRIQPPAAYAEHLTLPVGKAAPFPPPRQLELLHRMVLHWSTKLSLAGRMKRPTPTFKLFGSALVARDSRG